MARKYRRLRVPRRPAPRPCVPVRFVQMTDPVGDFLSGLVSGARRGALFFRLGIDDPLPPELLNARGDYR
ncbi:hypothetical protein SAMN05421828_12318 [Acidiphilium rubrum]|uniref:Uncharacterized protein n=1 Tax=Acidiphilium rubrum TaxID=526 RepID=A0A8G2FEH3_ACIRU|nr:hypothetical protein SAMN05421828_12318 [Acidiphilium rubrum]